MLARCRSRSDALWPVARPAHLTASAFVVDADGGSTLLTLHRKLGRWLQLGGHCDGDGDLARGALREATEESGIAGLTCYPQIVDLDIQTIPGRDEPPHLHLDVRFLIVAPRGARPIVSEESIELRWFSVAELESLHLDDGLRRLAARCFRSGARRAAGTS